MKINLDFLLRKKNITLFDFCQLNNLDSYDSLQKYCDYKNLICVDKEFYDDKIPNTISKESIVSKKGSKGEQSNDRSEKRQVKRRSTSKTPKVTKKRSTSSKGTS